MSLLKRQCGNASARTTPHPTTHPPSRVPRHKGTSYPQRCSLPRHAKTARYRAPSHASSLIIISARITRSALGQTLGTTSTAPVNIAHAVEDDVYTQNSMSYSTVRTPYPLAKNTLGAITSQRGNPYSLARKPLHTFATSSETPTPPFSGPSRLYKSSNQKGRLKRKTRLSHHVLTRCVE